MLGSFDLVFYILAIISVVCGLGVVTSRNPIYSAFYLALTMIGIAGLFVTLDAHFIAGVQLIVYAGAVMVLFVMVLMLFDLKHEMKTFSKGSISLIIKGGVALFLFGGFIAFIYYSLPDPAFKPLSSDPARAMETTKDLSKILFTKYLFAFEAIGALLLIIAVGAVTLSRIAGGTHANND